MQDGYPYGNARIRAMKSRLLGRRAYDDLLAATGIDPVIELLAGSDYKAEIEATLVKYGGMRCVAEALRLNVGRRIGKIKEFFAGRPRQLLGMLLARWDLFNLMTILRGQARNVPADEILETVVPAGELSEVDLKEMAQQPGLRATADLMLAWRLPYAQALATALRAGGELSEIETRLSQGRYQESLRALGADPNDLLVREMLEAEIDKVNLMILLRLGRERGRMEKAERRGGPLDATALLVQGGTLPRRLLKELGAAADVESVVRGLSGTPYGTILSSRLDDYRQRGDLASLERGLEEFLARKGTGMFHRDPLSIAVPIGYLWAKTGEVVNVRLIAQGKALGWERNAIQKNLTGLERFYG